MQNKNKHLPRIAHYFGKIIPSKIILLMANWNHKYNKDVSVCICIYCIQICTRNFEGPLNRFKTKSL